MRRSHKTQNHKTHKKHKTHRKNKLRLRTIRLMRSACAHVQDLKFLFSLTFSLIRSPQVHHRPQLIAETQGATIPINIGSALGLFLSHLPFALCLRPTQRSLLVHCTAVTPTATHLMRQDSGVEGPGVSACRYVAFKKP